VKRALLWAVFTALFACAVPGVAAADTCPVYDGAMSFGTIEGIEDPEDYCFEVSLGEGQDLRQIDDSHAAVFYSSGHRAFDIQAVEAHDAVGARVPTSLAVTGTNVITLTVHHRAGNPLADGAPFDYPVVAGQGWEGGFQTVEIKGPPDEAELQPKPVPGGEAPTAQCHVPALRGRSLRAARRVLAGADCSLGPVRGKRSRGARVTKQYRRSGSALPAGTGVGVKLA
jgi:hypothetical protein